MPKSLNNEESPVYKKKQMIIQSSTRAKPTATTKMVENALIALHNVKGVSLRKIYSYILDNYNLEAISKIREGLIKKCLKLLQHGEDLINVTGRGLSGRFKLVNKQDFCRKTKQTSKKSETITMIKRKTIMPVIPRQVTPVPSNISPIFGTPILPAQVHSSTPFLRSLVPRAPEVRKKVRNTRMNSITENENGTPRSSLPEKKRKLRTRHKK